MYGCIDWRAVERDERRRRGIKEPKPVPPKPLEELRILAARVDFLQLAYRVEFNEEILGVLKNRASLANEHGAAAFEEGECVGRLKASRARGAWHIDHAEYRVFVQEKAPGAEDLPNGEKLPGWNVEVVFSGTSGCINRQLTENLDRGRRLAEAFGKVKGERLRRIDLCADVSAFALAQEQASRIVRRPRAGFTVHADEPGADLNRAAFDYADAARKAEYDPTDEDRKEAAELARRKLWGAAASKTRRAFEDDILRAGDDPEESFARIHARRRVTGFTVCPGGDLMCRIYDKIEELKDSPARFEAENFWWSMKGYTEGTKVARVEFQIRGEALRDLGLRDPRAPWDPRTGEVFDRLEDRLNAVWAYCIIWTRLVELPKDKPEWAVRLTRCPDAPEWKVLEEVRFTEERQPIAGRRRLRSGASAEQTLGCMLSMLAERGALHLRDERMPVDDLGKLIDRVYGEVWGVARECVPLIAERLLGRWGPARAGKHFAVISNAARARFSEAHAWQVHEAAA